MKSLLQLHRLAGIAAILGANNSMATPVEKKEEKNVRRSSEPRRFRRKNSALFRLAGNLDDSIALTREEKVLLVLADDLFANEEEDAHVFGRILADDAQSMSMPPPPPPTTKRFDVAVYIPRVITTCFVGEDCDPEKEECHGLWNGNVLEEAFQPDTFRAVPASTDPSDTYDKVKCLRLVLSDAEVEQILAEMEDFAEGASEWSSGNIELDLHIIDYGGDEAVDLYLDRYGEGGFWISPNNFRDLAIPRLDFEPDFNLIVPPIRDPVSELGHTIKACGLANGAGGGIAGAGYSWIPKTSSSFGFECAERGIIGHEWLHQVYFAYQELSGFDDLYGDDFPACGKGHRNPKKWFPDTHQCHQDPDFYRCGEDDCGPGDPILFTHILTEHWDPEVDFIANHCQNGKRDYGETGVDVGGPCLAGIDEDSDKVSSVGAPGSQPADSDETVPDYVD